MGEPDKFAESLRQKNQQTDVGVAGVAVGHATRSVITCSIARSASLQYLIYSEADFEVCRPAGATQCTDGAKFGTEEGPNVPNFTPIGATVKV